MALAGGASILTASDIFAGLSRAHFLSPTGQCKTWDEFADGYCRADAVATVVLKRLDDAIMDRDNILGVIKSAATNHAPNASSITHPDAGAQQQLFQRVVQAAGLTARDIDHVEMHGTGTQAGDLAEVTSLVNAMGIRGRDKPLTIGAVKSNVGHSEAASGVTSLIKALLMIENATIPKHIGIKGQINPRLPPLKDHGIHIPLCNEAFMAKADGTPRRILINNFNATSGSSAIVVEEHQDRTHDIRPTKDPRDSHVFLCSGATSKSLHQNLQKLYDYIRNSPHVDIASLAYTLSARRTHHRFRAAYIAGSGQQLLDLLSADISLVGQDSSTQRKSVILVFTGQGSTYIGMASTLFATCSIFRSSLQRYDALYRNLGFRSFLPCITDKHHDRHDQEMPAALVAVEVALAGMLEHWGLEVAAVAGHSIGEYSALCIARVLSVADALHLVGARAAALRATCAPGICSMLSIRLDYERTQQALDTIRLDSCQVSCKNSPSATVVSGPAEDISTLAAELQTRSIPTRRLDTPYGYHSAQMDSTLPVIAKIASSIAFGCPKIPVASTLTGRVVTDGSTFNALYLQRHTREPVQFEQALCALSSHFEEQQPALWIELGPHPICLSLIKCTLQANENETRSVLSRNFGDWEGVSSIMASLYLLGLDLSWSNFHAPYRNSLRLLPIPKYCFDLSSHWIRYEGDWALRKNHPTAMSEITERVAVDRISTTIHNLAESAIEDGTLRATYWTDLTDSSIQIPLRDHAVHGVLVCSGALYADMALTAAALHLPTDKLEHLSVSAMEMVHPLPVAGTSQSLQTSIHYELESNVAYCQFTTVSETGHTVHARCTVRDESSDAYLVSLGENTYMIKNRIADLERSLTANKVSGSVAYKLWQPFIKYDSAAQSMQQIILEIGEGNLEAVAAVHLDAMLPDVESNPLRFKCCPRSIDSLSHISGFVANMSSDTLYNTNYICEGWRRLQMLQAPPAGRTYRSYTRMRTEQGGKLVCGNVYVFLDDELVALCEGLRYRRIHASVLQQNLVSLVASKSAQEPQEMHTLPRTINDTARTGIDVTKHKSLCNGESSKGINGTKNFTNLKSALAIAPQRSEPQTKTERPVKQSTTGLLMEIIGKELGVPTSTVAEAADIRDLGLDSIISPSIAAMFLDSTGIKLPPAFLNTHTTKSAINSFLIEAQG